MDDLTRTFLLKLAQTVPAPPQQAPQVPAPQVPQAQQAPKAPQAQQAPQAPRVYGLNIPARDFNVSIWDGRQGMEKFVDDTAADFKYWGGRLENDDAGFRLFERLNPDRAARVRALGGLAHQVALNPNEKLDVQATIDLGDRGWGEQALLRAGKAFGLGGMNAATHEAMTARLKEKVLDPNSPAMRYYKDLGAKNYLSNTFKDWTSGLGGFAQPANNFMQWLLTMISKVPGFSSLLGSFTPDRPKSGPMGNIQFNTAPSFLVNGQPYGTEKPASARVDPYSHYRRVATMPCGAEVLERWNRS
jgi:hypothetical protein